MVRIVIFIELVELDDLAQVVLRLRLLRLMRIKNCWEKFRLGITIPIFWNPADGDRFDVGISEMPDTVDTNTYMRA